MANYWTQVHNIREELKNIPQASQETVALVIHNQIRVAVCNEHWDIIKKIRKFRKKLISPAEKDVVSGLLKFLKK